MTTSLLHFETSIRMPSRHSTSTFVSQLVHSGYKNPYPNHSHPLKFYQYLVWQAHANVVSFIWIYRIVSIFLKSFIAVTSRAVTVFAHFYLTAVTVKELRENHPRLRTVICHEGTETEEEVKNFAKIRGLQLTNGLLTKFHMTKSAQTIFSKESSMPMQL